jgi:YesN/AraC family two-component response regulator
MNILTDPILSFLIVLLLLAILVVLIIAAARNRSRPTDGRISPIDKEELEQILSRIIQALEHHADVSAVVALIKGLDADPDALEKIKEFPEKVRATSWLHYINLLGVDLKAAQEHLSREHRSTYGSSSFKASMVSSAQTEVNSIRAKLDAAIEASGMSRVHAV